MSARSVLEVEDLEVHYGLGRRRRRVLDGVSLSVSQRRGGRAHRRDRFGQVDVRSRCGRARSVLKRPDRHRRARMSPRPRRASGATCADGAWCSTSSRTRCAASTLI